MFRWEERGSGTFFLLNDFDRPWLTLRWRIRSRKVSIKMLDWRHTSSGKKPLDLFCVGNQVDIKVYLGSEPPVGEAYLGDIDEPNLDIWYSACLALDTSA